MEKAPELFCRTEEHDELWANLSQNFTNCRIIYPLVQVNPRFVSSILGRYDHHVEINHHWVSEDSSPYKVWAGAVAHFFTYEQAKMTTDELLKHSDSLRVFAFDKWLRILLAAEERYPKPANEFTKVIIHTRGNFNPLSVIVLEEKLRIFGENNSFTVRSYGDAGSVGEVEYDTLTQAYAVMTILNGYRLHRLGCLNVTVEVTQSGKKYDSLIKLCFKEVLRGRDSPEKYL